MEKNIKDALDACPVQLDLTSRRQASLLYRLAEAILASCHQPEEVDRLSSSPESLYLEVAKKMARSRLMVEKLDQPLKVSVVFAVYKEHTRILPKEEHKNGEDFLRRKVKQLNWLFQDKTNIDWEILAVDDGCPEGSGHIAGQIVADNGLEKRVKVYFLEDGIKNNEAICKGLKSTNESQKGGSILYGMHQAILQSKSDEHIIVYTDADLSTHLTQIGLLLDPILNGGKKVSIGSRRETDSTVIKQGSRNDRGKLFIYLWKHLIDVIPDIIDTQCGFKAFHKSIIAPVLTEIEERKFAFDIELLFNAELIEKGCIERVAIAWIDSEAASTTTDLQPYLAMLKSISRMYRHYLSPNTFSSDLAEFIDSLSEDDFNALLSNIPEGITEREPKDFVSYSGVSVDDLKQAIKSTSGS